MEEYLEEQEIYLCNTVSNGTTSIYNTIDQVSALGNEQSIPTFALLGAVARGEIA